MRLLSESQVRPGQLKVRMGQSMNLAAASPAGALLCASGLFLVGEGLVSIFYSKDQQPISTVGRVARIGIGLGLLGLVYSKS